MAHNFTVVKKGYNPIEVDAYIKALEQKIEDYKEQSTAINRAIINAQIAADNIIKTAHAETDTLLREAENNAYKIKHKNLNQIIMLKNTAANQKRMIEEFQNDYYNLVNKYLTEIKQEDVTPLLHRIKELEDIITELTDFDQQPDEKADADSPALSATNVSSMTVPAEPAKVQPPNEPVQAASPYEPVPEQPYISPEDFSDLESEVTINPELLKPQGANSNYRPQTRVDSIKMSQTYEENIAALRDLLPQALEDEATSSDSILNSEELSVLLPFSEHHHKS